MKILDDTITNDNLREMAQNYFGDMVKGVVDIERNLLALDANLHSDLEAMLLENDSTQEALWGINLYPDIEDDDFLEFDSMINLRPSQGNRSRGVDDEKVRQRIRAVVNHWIKR